MIKPNDNNNLTTAPCPRMSTRLTRFRQARPGGSGVRERDKEDTIQELEACVAMLESQKGVLQNKLSLAKQHILDLGGRTTHRFSKGVCVVKRSKNPLSCHMTSLCIITAKTLYFEHTHHTFFHTANLLYILFVHYI